MYGSKYSFNDYENVRKNYNIFFMTKHDKNMLKSFYYRLNEFRNLIPRTEKAKMKEKSLFKNAANLYNRLLTIYFNGYDSIMVIKKSRWMKIMIIGIYFLKFTNIMFFTKKMKKKVNHSQKKKSS